MIYRPQGKSSARFAVEAAVKPLLKSGDRDHARSSRVKG